jgi:hypothetical protein
MAKVVADDFNDCCNGAQVQVCERDVQKTWNGVEVHRLWTERQYRCARCGRVLKPLRLPGCEG